MLRTDFEHLSFFENLIFLSCFRGAEHLRSSFKLGTDYVQSSLRAFSFSVTKKKRKNTTGGITINLKETMMFTIKES